MNKTNKHDDRIVVDELKENLAKSKSELAILKKESREQNKIAREMKKKVKTQRERVEHNEYLIWYYTDCQKSRVRLMALIGRGFSAEYIQDTCVHMHYGRNSEFNERWELSYEDISLIHKVVAGKIELSDIPRQCMVSRGEII